VEEGTLSEELVILGWKINTRSLTIALPEKKYSNWHEDLSNYVKAKKISQNNLESLIGLNHAVTACPLMRYYLNRVRKLLEHWNTKNTCKKAICYLSTTVLEDLKLWLTVFLPRVKSGISLNLITFRSPSYMCWSDSCPQGLVIFQSGVSHRNNALELVAAIITVWQASLSGDAPTETCFLSFCNNSSVVGWLHKANIDDTQNLPLHSAAQKHAEILLNSNCCLYSQHIAGARNNVADALSRKNDLQDTALTQFILSTYPSQVPISFHIKPLHKEIHSWLTSWLHSCKEITVSRKTQEIKRQGYGKDGKNMPKSSDMTMTFGLPTSPYKNEQPSWEPLPQPSKDVNFLDQVKTWQLQQCKRPWQSWVRSLGQTWGTTPHMATEKKVSTHPSQDNLNACETKTQGKTSKKPYLCASTENYTL
jgi:hypothetical protein